MLHFYPRTLMVAFGMALVFCGCVAYQTAGLAQSGRVALQVKEPERALTYFQDDIGKASSTGEEVVLHCDEFHQSFICQYAR